jgi:hypothetical protein
VACKQSALVGKPIYVGADHVLVAEAAKLRPQVVNAYQKYIIPVSVDSDRKSPSGK